MIAPRQHVWALCTMLSSSTLITLWIKQTIRIGKECASQLSNFISHGIVTKQHANCAIQRSPGRLSCWEANNSHLLIKRIRSGQIWIYRNVVHCVVQLYLRVKSLDVRRNWSVWGSTTQQSRVACPSRPPGSGTEYTTKKLNGGFGGSMCHSNEIAFSLLCCFRYCCVLFHWLQC